MKLSSNNFRDLDKYFTGSYVKYPAISGDKLFYVTEIGPDFIMGNHYENGIEEPYSLKLWEEGSVEEEYIPSAEFLLPVKSYFMHEGLAYFLYRLPSRQYKRGICRDNTRIEYLNPEGVFTPVSFSWKLLEAYVNKQTYLPFDLEGKYRSYALARRMACTENGDIFVDRVMVGKFLAARKEIVLKNGLFREDIESILRFHGQDFKISVNKSALKRGVV